MLSLPICECPKDHGVKSFVEPIVIPETHKMVRVCPLGMRFENYWINFGLCKHCDKAKLSKEDAKLVLWDAIEKAQKEQKFLTGKEIKEFRKQTKMKAKDLAELTKMNRSVLSAIENGYLMQSKVNNGMIRKTIEEYLRKNDPVKKKLKNVFCYMIDQIETSKIFLNKMLFYIDFWNYKITQKSITESEYVPMQYGPCPRDYQEILQEMIIEGDIIPIEGHCFKLNKDLDMEEFTKQEIQTIDTIIGLAQTDKGRKLFNLSHQELGFKETPMMQTISYEKYAKDLKIEELLNEIAETG